MSPAAAQPGTVAALADSGHIQRGLACDDSSRCFGERPLCSHRFFMRRPHVSRGVLDLLRPSSRGSTPQHSAPGSLDR
jgi:hypothetical protein